VADVAATAAGAAVDGAAAVFAAWGVTVTVWVTVAVAVAAGTGGAGGTGSADALAPVKPSTATEPAATPPTSTRQLRVILFIADVLFARSGRNDPLV